MGLKKRLLSWLLILLLCGTSFFAITNQNGALYGLTNADGEDNCTHCHNYYSLITSGNYHDSISLTSRFNTNGYLPDSLYIVTISLGFKGIIKAGFQTCFLDTGHKNAGVIIPAAGVQKLYDANYLRMYATHTADHNSGNGNTPMVWQFKWQAPPKNIGEVKVFCTFVVANNDATYSGDSVFAKVFTISPSNEIPVSRIKTNTTTICNGQSLNLSDAGSTNALKWLWIIKGPTNQTITGKSIVFTPKTSGNYNVILKNQNNKAWSENDTLSIVVKPQPKAVLNKKGNIQKCTEDSILLNFSSRNYTTIKWSDGLQKATTRYITDTGSYFIQVDSGGCHSISETFKIQNFPKYPITTLHEPSSDTLCFDSKISIKTSTAIALSSTSFYASGKKLTTVVPNQLLFSLNKDTIIYAQGIDANQCLTQISDPIKLILAPKPNVHFTFKNTGLTYAFHPNDTGNQRYLWQFGEYSAYSFKKHPVYRYSQTGKPITVTLETKNRFDCPNKDSLVINLPLFVDKLLVSGMKIYPNPANEFCTLQMQNIESTGTLTIFNLVGKLIYQTQINQTITEISTENLNEGIYFFNINLPSGKFNIPVTVNHKN